MGFASDSDSSADERAVLLRAARRGVLGPGIALASSFVALGALLRDSGMELWQSAFCTFIVFALPGQIVAAELYARDAAAALVLLSVLLVNMRLLPMTIALLPLLRPREKRGWRDFLLAHLIAVTSWASFMNARDSVPPLLRYRYFVWTGGALWICGIAATALGYAAGGALPPWLLAGLLFLNPAYFLFMMMRALSRKADSAALVFGMILLPFLHPVAGAWDIIICGVVGGGAAFLLYGRGG